MELLKIEDNAEFRTYVAQQRDQGLNRYLAPLRPYQHLYYILSEQLRIGFVDLHHLPGRDDARINFYYLENRQRLNVKTPDLASIFEEKAKKLGARTLALELSGDPEELLHNGWETISVSYLLQKLL